MFAIGVAATVATLIAVALPPTITQPCVTCMDRVSFFGLPPAFSVPVLGAVTSVAGLVWMLRILRGSRDEPPAWRYRDHD